MKKIKVVHTPVRFYPYVGGVEYTAYYICNELYKLGYDVSVICSDELNTRSVKIKNLVITRLKYYFKIANTNITLFLPLKLLFSDFDIVHTYMPTPWSADWSVIIARIKNKKSIISICNDMHHEGVVSNLFSRIYLNTFFKLTLYLVNKIVIVNSQWEYNFIFTKKILEKYKNKIVTIPNGIDTQLFKPERVVKQNAILFVSILSKYHSYKGIEYLIYSMPGIIKKIPNVKLWIIGDGELKKYLIKKVDAMRLNENIIFLGSKKQEDLKFFYNSAKVFALPSTDTEGFGSVLLEAMACGTPVVATNIVGMAKEIKKNVAGIIIEPRSSKKLTTALVTILLNEKLSNKMSKNAYELVISKFSWNRVTRNFDELYQKVLSI